MKKIRIELLYVCHRIKDEMRRAFIYTNNFIYLFIHDYYNTLTDTSKAMCTKQ